MSRPWIVGGSDLVTVGEGVNDGLTARITDPVTGAGLFNPNMDPAIVGIDPLTGVVAPTGTDMGPGAMFRRQVHTNVINGDFAVGPPGGAGSAIVSDPNDAGYNPLPGWTWTPDAAGLQVLTWEADTAFGSGYKIAATGMPGSGELWQLVPVPISKGQQYRVLPSAFTATMGPGSAFVFAVRYYDIDLVAIGSEMTRSASTVTDAEAKIDAGLVPTDAAYIKLIARFTTTSDVRLELGEVRCAFLPAEAEVGLKSIIANVGAITTTQTQVVAATIPANSFTSGSVYRIRAFGTCTSSAANVVTFRIRVGTTTLTGNIVASVAPTATTTASSHSFELDALIVVRATGASGTALGGMSARGTGPGTAQPFSDSHRVSTNTATVTVDTTVANLIELTAVTAAGTTSVTFHVATIECVMAS